MTGWQVQAMWEADTAALWERLNEPDPLESQLKDAARSMMQTVDMLDKAENGLIDAASELEDTPMADKLMSLYEAIIDLKIDVKILAEKYERGQRE